MTHLLHALCPYCDVRFPVAAAAPHVTLDELADAWSIHIDRAHPPRRQAAPAEPPAAVPVREVSAKESRDQMLERKRRERAERLGLAG